MHVTNSNKSTAVKKRTTTIHTTITVENLNRYINMMLTIKEYKCNRIYSLQQKNGTAGITQRTTRLY